MEAFGCLANNYKEGIQVEWRAQHNLLRQSPVDEVWVGLVNEASDAFIRHKQQHIVERVLGGDNCVVAFLQFGHAGAYGGDEILFE